MITTDFELIEQVRSGNEEAFAQLLKHYTPYVYRTAFAFLHDEHESEDAAQEIFLKVYRSIKELQDISAFNAWLKRIITNTCLDRLRKKRPTPVPDIQLNQIVGKSLQKWDRRILVYKANGKSVGNYHLDVFRFSVETLPKSILETIPRAISIFCYPLIRYWCCYLTGTPCHHNLAISYSSGDSFGRVNFYCHPFCRNFRHCFNHGISSKKLAIRKG